jgi:predicted CoA-binding protein
MTECQLPDSNPCDDEISTILKNARTIAVVGISHKEDRDSHKVARYLKAHGYQMIPVNPKYREVLGETCYATLRDVPHHIDVVDIFRNVEAIPAIVDEAIAVSADCVWMQLGLTDNEAAAKARSAGLKVVMNRCTKIEHGKLPKT